MSLVGIDVGSTGCKAVAYTDVGKCIAGAYREYKVETSGYFAELESESVWKGVIECLREITCACENDSIKALSVSAMSDTMTPMSINAKPLMKSIMSFDARAMGEIEEVKARINPFQLYEITGMPLHPMHLLLKIMWLKKNRAKLEGQVWKYLSFEEYVLWKLGAEPSCSYSIAGRSMLFNNQTKSWDQELLEIFGINKNQLPLIYASGTQVGCVSKATSELTGLSQKTKLVTGGFDQACCAAACGVFEKGQMLDTTGTNEILFFIADDHDKKELFHNHFSYSYHVVEGVYSSFGHMFNAGGGIQMVQEPLF